MLNEYRGASMLLRENTKEINIGGVKIGGTNRIAIQSMTNTFTEDVDKTVAQILKPGNGTPPCHPGLLP